MELCAVDKTEVYRNCGKFKSMHGVTNSDCVLTVAVLFLHAPLIVGVVFGAWLTETRPSLRWLHIVSLIY
jgi:hypothetical protein